MNKKYDYVILYNNKSSKINFHHNRRRNFRLIQCLQNLLLYLINSAREKYYSY